MHNNQLMGRGTLHGLGVMAYCAAVSQVISHSDQLFGHMDTVLTGAAFLMLLTLSAATVGALIFGKPALLYAEGKKQQAIMLVGYTLGTLAILTILLMVVVAAR